MFDPPHFGYTTTEHGERLRRQYSVTSRAWYADSALPRNNRDNVVDEVTVGHYSTDGGSTGEFEIKLVQMEGPAKPPAMQVCVFTDAWHLFKYEIGLFQRLALLEDPTLAELERVLQIEGFTDKTQTRSPYEATPTLYRKCERCRRPLIPPEADDAVVYCGRRDCVPETTDVLLAASHGDMD